jgi:glycosyltransferase involved in cell wall biosynthesis
MTIGIDANEANQLNRVGSNVFAFEVLWQLYKQDKQNDYLIYLNARPLGDLPPVRKGWQYRLVFGVPFWTQWRLPLDLWLSKLRPKIFLTLGHYAPRLSPVPTIICIMDLAFLKYPKTFRKKDLWQLKSWTKYSVRRAARILAISEATKKDIVNYYGVAENKITVAYPGVEKFSVRGKSPVKGEYLLYLGTLQPRKNIDALIEGFGALPFRNGNEKLKLVIAGKIGWKYKLKKQKKVTYLGFVPQEKIGSLIKKAQALILPSLYEGFGIPVAQAMSLGVPVVVSRNSSLVEIVGKNGVYIDPPFDSEAIRKGIIEVLTMKVAKKKKMIMSANLRSKQFSWFKTGQRFLEVLNNV